MDLQALDQIQYCRGEAIALFTLKPASGAFKSCALGKLLTFCLSFPTCGVGIKTVSRGPGERVSGKSQCTGLIPGWGSLWSSGRGSD